MFTCEGSVIQVEFIPVLTGRVAGDHKAVLTVDSPVFSVIKNHNCLNLLRIC